MTYDDIISVRLRLLSVCLLLYLLKKESISENRSQFYPSLLNSTRFSISCYQKARMSIQNLQVYDPFTDASKGVNEASIQEQPIHIRIQQRSGRKTLTTVQGIHEAYDKKKLVKAFKKEFNCNGTVIVNPEYGEVIQLQGDQRTNIAEFLMRISLARKDQLHIHGF